MKKIGNVSEETEKLFDKIVEEAGLVHYMNVRCLYKLHQNQIVKVSRASETTEHIGGCPDSVFIYLNEDVFDRLTDRQKELVAREAVNQIYYDSEKDKITITQPQICCTISGRQAFGDELIDTLETCVLIKEQLDEEERERKSAEKAAKKSKK